MHSTDNFPALQMGDIFLNPGDMHCGFAPARVWTILGSCVSIVIWHKRLRFGAMTHYLLPERGTAESSRSRRLDARYGEDACRLVLASMQRFGIPSEECQARIFGGSQMLIRGRPAGSQIGQKNAAIAHEFLSANHIKLVSESLFGSGHRRVYFDLSTGRVWENEAHGAKTRQIRKRGSFV